MPLVFLCFMLMLSSCSSPADISDMVYKAPEQKKVTTKSKYFKNVFVKKVTGGSDTEFYNDAKISNSHFKKAIEESLEAANILGTPDRSTYALTAEIVDFNQQSFGSKPTTAIHVKFTLHNEKHGDNVFADTYGDDEFATDKDSLRRGEKVEIATERAAKGVIHKLLDRFLA